LLDLLHLAQHHLVLFLLKLLHLVIALHHGLLLQHLLLVVLSVELLVFSLLFLAQVAEGSLWDRQEHLLWHLPRIYRKLLWWEGHELRWLRRESLLLVKNRRLQHDGLDGL